MPSSFSVSYASLRPAGASGDAAPDRAFRLLAVADGPDISHPAAAALLGVPPEQAERALELLVDCHLLQSAAPGRYRFHDLLRVYAREQVLANEDAAERDEAVRRMLRWYVHTAAAAARLVHPNGKRMPPCPADAGSVPLTFASYAQALAWLDAEYANLVAAVGQAARQGEHELAWKLPASLWALFYLRGHAGDWIATHQTGLASARLLGDSTAELWILNNLGVAYIHAKRPEAAIGCLRQCLPVVRKAGDLMALARVLVNLGYTLADIGRDDEAMQSLLESLCLCQEMGNRCGEGIALGGIGKVHRRRGQLSDAIAHYQRALDASRETSDLVTEGTTLVELSAVRLELGQAGAATRTAMEAVEFYRQTGNRYGHAQAIAVLGRAERERGHPAQARQHWLDAVAIFTELGLPQADEVAACLNALESGDEGTGGAGRVNPGSLT